MSKTSLLLKVKKQLKELESCINDRKSKTKSKKY